MSLSEDSPPFVNLQKSAEDFRNVFDNDISSLSAALDSKISALVCDPDSLGSSLDSRRKSNAHVEFSMAKLNVMSHMKNLVEDALERWTEQLDSLRDQFLDNVQEFLSNTKLEVKLPSPIISPKLGKKKSPAKPSPQVSSLYPKLFETAKSIPGISAFLPKNNEVEETSDEEEEPLPPPVTTPRPSGRNSKRASILKEYVPSPSRNGSSKKRESQASTNVSIVTLCDEEEEMEQEEPVLVKRGRPKRGRTPLKTPKKNNAAAMPELFEEDVMEVTEESFAYIKNTPKPKNFSLGLDPNEELDIYSPILNVSRSATRRKTVVVPEVDLTPVSRAKRKTLAGSQLDSSVAPSPKRFKSGGRKSMVNLLEEEDEGGPWLPLASSTAGVAAMPGVYELKVATAKKPAFIGACNDLQDTLAKHKNRAPTGKKNLDKFVERNAANLQVRFQPCADLQDAKMEEKERVKKFVDQYHTTPAQN